MNELTEGDDHLGVRGEDPIKYASYEFGDKVLQELLEKTKNEIKEIQ